MDRVDQHKLRRKDKDQFLHATKQLVFIITSLFMFSHICVYEGSERRKHSTVLERKNDIDPVSLDINCYTTLKRYPKNEIIEIIELQFGHRIFTINNG